MTLDEVIQQPWYWALLITAMVVGTLALKVRPLDFRFVALLFLSQYVAHTAVASGLSVLTIFASSAWAAFIAGSLVVQQWTRGNRSALAAPRRAALSGMDPLWAIGSRVFLLAYWSAHLALIPPTFGAVDIQQRLDQFNGDVLISFLGSLALPALAACMWVWLGPGYRLRWYDLLPLGLSLVGMLGSDSKVSVLPLLIAFAGVTALRRKPLKEMRVAAAAAVIALLALAVRLVFYYPGGDPSVALKAIAYRIAANTDSVDYLVRSGLMPSDYPFAGPAALIPFITKRLGYDYQYGPGVWLYGVATGNYQGFGPNPGLLMDYFANLGWAGVVVPLLLGVAAASLARKPGAVSASLLSVLYLAFVDVQLFELAALPQVALLGVLLAIRALPATRQLSIRVEAWTTRATAPPAHVDRLRVSTMLKRLRRGPIAARRRSNLTEAAKAKVDGRNLGQPRNDALPSRAAAIGSARAGPTTLGGSAVSPTPVGGTAADSAAIARPSFHV